LLNTTSQGTEGLDVRTVSAKSRVLAFAFNDRSDAHPFGTFLEVKNGGKIIVMGDGMVSLYMTSWEGVQDYQCQEFMQSVFRWLLK
jgi:hypothetical protein